MKMECADDEDVCGSVAFAVNMPWIKGMGCWGLACASSVFPLPLHLIVHPFLEVPLDTMELSLE